MCGRFTLSRSGRELAEHFEVQGAEAQSDALAWTPRFNIAPSQDVLVVRADEQGGRSFDRHRWGLVPFWAKDKKIGNRLINARSESAAEKPAYREALRQRRCLVVADGFYEWGGRGAERRAHLFRLREARAFGIAGLWERWTDPEDPTGDVLHSCTLLTTEANSLVRDVHVRMPVILDSRDYAAWLDPQTREASGPSALLVPCPSDWMERSEVGSHVNDPRNEDPRCAEPVIAG